jgi:hypothetical protein
MTVDEADCLRSAGFRTRRESDRMFNPALRQGNERQRNQEKSKRHSLAEHYLVFCLSEE